MVRDNPEREGALVFTFCCPCCGGESGSRDEPQECNTCRSVRLHAILETVLEQHGEALKRLEDM